MCSQSSDYRRMKKEREQGKAAGLLLIMHLKRLVARRRRRKEALTTAAAVCQSCVRKRQARSNVVNKRQTTRKGAAMAIQQTFRTMRRVGWRTKRRNYLRQIQAVTLQRHLRGAMARLNLRRQRLVAKWFGRLWRKFYARKYSPVVRQMQVHARRFLLGRRILRIQNCARQLFARHRAADRLHGVLVRESIRATNEVSSTNKQSSSICHGTFGSFCSALCLDSSMHSPLLPFFLCMS